MDESAISINDALASDAEAIRDLAVRIWNDSYPGIISQEQIDYMLGWMSAPEQIRREMERDSIVYLKIELEDHLRGFASFGPGDETDTESVNFIHKLYVDPHFHRRGMGSAALAEIENRSRTAGLVWIKLRVNRENRQAIAAYEKNGYGILETLCSDIGDGFVMDDFVMGKRIS